MSGEERRRAAYVIEATGRCYKYVGEGWFDSRVNGGMHGNMLSD